jgi:hypothetical protein
MEPKSRISENLFWCKMSIKLKRWGKWIHSDYTVTNFNNKKNELVS